MSTDTIQDARAAAKAAALRHVSDEAPGIGRRRMGRHFSYRLPKGGPVKDPTTLRRIKALAIPPAWTQVWICPQDNGHIQATGRDEKGRKQYRYHPRWRETRDAAKFGHMVEFARALPRIRAQVEAHMRLPGLPRQKVLATVVRLLETTLIRVGNDDYAKQNGSYGLTTLRNRHVSVEGSKLRFRFKGKSGKDWQLQVTDRRVARILRECQDLPGQELFQYVDEDGELRSIDSSDVNDYLRDIAGEDVTAKDFRTWAGTVLAALALHEFERFDTQAAAKRNVKRAIEQVSARLGNTPTICRKCYVHPGVLDLYMDGGLALQVKAEAEAELTDAAAGLKPEEAAVLGLLIGRLARDGLPAKKAVVRAAPKALQGAGAPA
ncbi:DNA topoisomerase IB [Paracraurococcus ruber]|uniref:DNA topoisomerase n=1 Tax=Paracraurococcus ruber TaxID=77675 RepID=A0ABS1CXT6_9PROT|nr:DNA topoisomerase IB [Paracraurococcus ruber]MBK1659135.1 DNA topoisomerase I [Paracraurococcus ruber]TDG31919.1 DNA topoisomerase IB [Paracraurococcus ruber]